MGSVKREYVSQADAQYYTLLCLPGRNWCKGVYAKGVRVVFNHLFDMPEETVEGVSFIFGKLCCFINNYVVD